MEYHLYILKLSNGRYYTGITYNVDKRFREHQEGFVVSTKGFLPVELKFSQSFESQKIARKYEVKVKSWSQTKKEKLIIGEWILN